MDKPVMIIGAGGLGKAALDIFKSNGILVYGFLDDDTSLIGSEIEDISVLGESGDDSFVKLIGPTCEAFVALEDPEARTEMGALLIEKRQVMPVNAIHSSAIIASSASLQHGSLINAGVIISSGVSLGSFCVIHSGAIIDFLARVGGNCQIGAGAVINSSVQIGENVLVGAGATVAAGVKVGPDARIAPGSVVVTEVKKGQTVFGNPALVLK